MRKEVIPAFFKKIQQCGTICRHSSAQNVENVQPQNVATGFVQRQQKCDARIGWLYND